MRTRDSSESITELPPPPAPTARDANPWPMTAEPARVSRRHRRVMSREPSAASGPDAPEADTPRSAGPRLGATVLFAVMMIAVAIMRLREGGNLEDLAGVLFALVVLVLFAVTGSRRSKRAAAKRARDGGDDS